MKNYLLIVLISFVFATIIIFFSLPLIVFSQKYTKKTSTNIAYTENYKKFQKENNKKNNKIRNKNIYNIEFSNNSKYIWENYLADFNIENYNIKENNNYYKIETTNGYFNSHKYLNFVSYEFKNNLKQYNDLKTEYELNIIAKSIINKYKLQKSDSIIEMYRLNDNFYEFVIVDKLDNIYDKSFNNSILIDKYGNIEKVNYFFISTEKLDKIKLKSFEEAYSELYEIEKESPFLLDSELQYIYTNSIIQPAYYFKYKNSNDEIKEKYILASKY